MDLLQCKIARPWQLIHYERVLLYTDTHVHRQFLLFCVFVVGISGPGQPRVKVMEVCVSGGHGARVYLLPQSVL